MTTYFEWMAGCQEIAPGTAPKRWNRAPTNSRTFNRQRGAKNLRRARHAVPLQIPELSMGGNLPSMCAGHGLEASGLCPYEERRARTRGRGDASGLDAAADDAWAGSCAASGEGSVLGGISVAAITPRSRCLRARMRSRRAAARSNSKFLAASRICASSCAMACCNSCFAGDVADGHVVRRHGDVIGFDDSRELHVHGLDDGFRRDVVFAVVGFLLGAAAIGFADGLAHRVGHAVGVENRAAFDVARATAHV